MTYADLVSFRRAFPGCERAVFVDLSTLTVLCSDGAVSIGQEHLDALCAEAQAAFGQPDTDMACILRPTGQRVFVRLRPNMPEVLCAVCSPDCDITGMRAALSQSGAAP